MIQDKIFFDEKDPTGLSYNTPFTFYGSYQGRLWSKSPTGSIKYYTQNSDLSAYATTGSNQFSGSQTITGSLTVTGTITGTVAGTTATASYVEYTNVANKPALVSGSSQVTYSGLTGIPSGIVSGSSQVTYSGLTGIPSGIVSGSAQVASFGIFATTGSNGFNGSQSITGSLTVTGQVVAQTLNVQQVTSSIVYSSGSNVFGNTLGNTQQFTGSVSVTGSLTSNGALSGTSATFTGTALLGGATATNPLSIRTANGESYIRFLNADGSSYGDLERSITGAGAIRFTGANFRFTAGAEVVGALTGSIATFSSSVTANDTVTINTSVTPLRFGNLIRWGFQRPGSDNRYISFMRNMDATATPVWTVDGDNGNIGIGTASPSQQLSVKKVDNLTTAIASFAANNLTQQVEIWYAGIRAGGTSTDVDLYLSSKNAGSLVCETNGIERMRITSTGAIVHDGLNVRKTKSGGTSVTFTINLAATGYWAPGYATVRVAASRGGLQELYSAMYFLRITYYQGSNSSAVYNIGGDTGAASVTVTSALVSSQSQITITVSDAGASTDYLIADIDASFQTGIASIT